MLSSNLGTQILNNKQNKSWGYAIGGEKPYTKCDGETSPRPFSEKLKLSISLDLLYYLFLLHAKLKAHSKVWHNFW